MTPHDIARKFELLIKGAVAKRFFINPDELSILLEDEDGVYVTDTEPDILCSLVIGLKNGSMYLVTAKILDNGKGLENFKPDIIL